MWHLSRRSLLALAGGGIAAAVGTRLALPHWLRAGPVRETKDLSNAARELVAACFADLDPARVWDMHAHVVGLGFGGSGCWVSPKMKSHWHPLRRLQYDLYLAASGVDGGEATDRRYAERLLALQRAANPHGKILLLALDMWVAEDGRELSERSTFYTPNDYVLALAGAHPEALAVASVHPYRKDALARLERAAAAGAVAVKWLPNAMGMDPAAPRCAPFYARLVELGLPLLSHAGHERAVHARDAQELGNPLRLRRALDAGVRVIIAHCASTGEALDLDAGSAGGRKPCFELFRRLMREERYRAHLFADISALTLVNRCGQPLRELLGAGELHERLVNGSDYPLPAIDPAVSTRLLEQRGYLSAESRGPLEEIYDANPLLFDYVLKRLLATDEGGERKRFSPCVFESARLFT